MSKREPYLGNPQATIAVLNKYGFTFQKKFGQNFLIDLLRSKRGGDHIQGQVHRADGLILTFTLQMRKVAIHPVDQARDMVCKIRYNLCTFLFSNGIGTSALFFRFNLIAVSILVPPLPLGTLQLAVAVLVKSLLRAVEHELHLQFLDL